jgi:hypothetical protein
MFTASVCVERVRCRLEFNELSQNTHASPQHFLVLKMERLPRFGISKRSTWLSVVIIWINGRGTPYSSLNQRLIYYGHLGPGIVDLVSLKSPSLLQMQ